MKKLTMLLACLAFAAAVAGLAIAVVNFLERRRDMLCCEDDEFDDELFDVGQDYYARPVDEPDDPQVQPETQNDE